MKTQNLNNDSDTFLAKWLGGELSDAELKHLVSEDDFRAFLKIRKALDVSDSLEAPLDNTFAKVKHRIKGEKTKVKPLYNRWIIGVAASIVLLFGLFSIFGNGIHTVETGFGESKSIVLLDGSEVILNSKSQITYSEDNWEENRTLRLEGEAYFKVAKGKTFTVQTNNGSVVVLGTQFNVNSTQDFFEVVCYEGKVGVKTTKYNHFLTSNESVNRINDYPTTVSMHSDNQPAWINGESTFKSVPLRYVIEALKNQYDVTFDVNAIDDTVVYTGSFPHDNLDVALKTVFETFDITYTEKEKRNIKLGYKE